jgi:hypothetical protein
MSEELVHQVSRTEHVEAQRSNRFSVQTWIEVTAEEDAMPLYATYIIPNDEATRRVRGLADDCGVEVVSFDQETMTRPCTVTVRARSREALDTLSADLDAEPEDVREE